MRLMVMRSGRGLLSIILIGNFLIMGRVSAAEMSVTSLAAVKPSVAVVGQAAGPTAFITQLLLVINKPAALRSIQFSIVPKPGSVTRPLSATYFSDYLQSRGYFNLQTGNITLPVFGLYSDYVNTVTLVCSFTNGSSQQLNAMIMTPPFSDPCGHDTPTVLQSRTNDALSYDYILIKTQCGTYSPVIIDTDGAIRWVGNEGQLTTVSMFAENGVYIASEPPGSSQVTGISRIELDGTFKLIKDLSPLGVINLHHNLDPGKTGMLVAVDTATQFESTVLEIDFNGNLIKRWNLADIISAAMTAGGDDPSQFVKSSPNDWFHNNAATYRSSDDTILISSRENFIIALDYQTGAIKWILGDPTKQWYQFPSLRQYALTVPADSLPPIGQHALSFTHDDALLLFDNGQASQNHVPAGAQRSYSSPRKYQLNLQAKTATEIWNYPAGQTLDSQFCSSVYEDVAFNYLIDYAFITNLGAQTFAELAGLTPAGNKVFEYRYPTAGCNTAFNSTPVHWERIAFTGPAENQPTAIPKVTVRVSPQQIAEGGSATFTISRSSIDPSAALTINYVMSGSAVNGSDYNLTGPVGQLVIPAGQTSATVVLTAMSDGLPERAENAKMTLIRAADYKLATKSGSATVKITRSR